MAYNFTLSDEDQNPIDEQDQEMDGEKDGDWDPDGDEDPEIEDDGAEIE